MNSLVLKIGAILIFAAGVITFVAFRSGYFDKEQTSDTKQPLQTIEEQPENDPIEDTVLNLVEEISSTETKLDETRPAITSPEVDRERMHSSKSFIMVEPEDFHMHSSKSAPIFNPSDLTPNPLIPPDTNRKPAPYTNGHEPNSNENINNAPGRQQMGGSKSIRMFHATDLKVADTTDR